MGQHRRAMMALAPRTVQNMPDCLRREPITVLQPASILGGHPTSGHRGSLQNRPTDRSQDLTLLYRVGGRRGKKFLICVAVPWHSGYTGFAWAEDSGNAGMRPERRPRCRNGGAAANRPRPPQKLAILAQKR